MLAIRVFLVRGKMCINVFLFYCNQANKHKKCGQKEKSVTRTKKTIQKKRRNKGREIPVMGVIMMMMQPTTVVVAVVCCTKPIRLGYQN